jgi:hypothetical protein
MVGISTQKEDSKTKVSISKMLLRNRKEVVQQPQVPQVSDLPDAPDAPERAAASQRLQTELTDEKKIKLVQSLFKDKRFSASFSGITTLQRAIKLEKGIYLPQKLISRAVNQIPTYVQRLKTIKKYPRSHYDVTALWQVRFLPLHPSLCWRLRYVPFSQVRSQSKCFFQLVQMDIGFLYPYNNYSAFLLLTDVFSVSS